MCYFRSKRIKDQMRKNALLYLCLMMSACTYADGGRQDIEDICSISFPAPAHITALPWVKNYFYSTDTCSYLVQVKPPVKKDVVVDTASLYAFYRGAVKGILRGYHGTLIGQKNIIIDGVLGAEVEYIKPDENHKPESVCTRMLLLGDRLVLYTFSSPYSHFMGYRHLKDSFFVSFAVHHARAAMPAAAMQDSTPTPRYDSVPIRYSLSSAL
jgi:hypothetical protein